jgi:LacI family transcriptional regulator
MKKRTTLADIAKAANVSMMTVSRVINNKPGVTNETREHILDLIKEMEYQPNAIARSLVTNKTKTIGLVVPDITNPFFAQIARGVEDAAYEHEYTILLINTNEELEREMNALDSLWQKDIDGIILCSSRLPEPKLIAQIQRFPATVLLNREVLDPQPNLVSINVNDQRGVQRAIQHFVEIGRKKIAFLGGPNTSFSSQRRLEGYRTALRTAQIAYDENLIVYNQPNIDGGYKATTALLSKKTKVDAIFAFNDLMAIGAIQACQKGGHRVPEDIAVIGVDDIPLSSIFHPRLTTLHVNLQQTGRLATRTLLDIIGNEALPASYQIEFELITRESA